MKFRNLIILLITVLSLNSCFIGDTDDLEVVYQPTLIELVCQTNEISMFCKMIYMTSKYPNGSGLASGSPIAAWQLQFSGRGPHDPTTGQACASNVETVFAPNNDAFNEFFQNFPHWLDSNGEVVLDSIPQDSLDMIILHHIYSNNTNGLGAKLYVEIENPVCSEQQIIRGSNNPYKMMDGNNFIFAENAQGNVAALSVLTNRFSIIESPDLATTDGAIYIINNVLGPF